MIFYKLTDEAVIADFESQQVAEQWFAEKAYHVNGVYHDVKILPFIDAQDFIAKQG